MGWYTIGNMIDEEIEFVPHDGKCLVCGGPSEVLVLCDDCFTEYEANQVVKKARKV
jgi:NMD protein affecting ribosome stability and mRNA decay